MRPAKADLLVFISKFIRKTSYIAFFQGIKQDDLVF